MKKLFLGITTLSLSLFCSAPLWAAPVTPPKPAKNVETRITSCLLYTSDAADE